MQVFYKKEDLLDYSILKKYDKQEMYLTYEQWPDIAEKHYSAALDPINLDSISHIVFAGMGGSGAISDIFSSILSETDIHVDVIKGYHLPKTANSKTLVVATSISGNTEETLSVVESALKKNCKTISFSNGGKMEKFCTKNGIDYQKIALYHSPRASFTSFLYSMLKVLHPILPINENDITESLAKLRETRKVVSYNNMTETNPALELAVWVTKMPVIYYPEGLRAAAIRFKNSLQENAKKHAMAEDVIEACHNGIVPWIVENSVIPILIQGKDDHFKTKERWNILKDFFERNKINYKEIFSIDGSILTKLINLIYLLDYSTIYRAAISEVDPTPIEPIDFVKRSL